MAFLYQGKKCSYEEYVERDCAGTIDGCSETTIETAMKRISKHIEPGDREAVEALIRDRSVCHLRTKTNASNGKDLLIISSSIPFENKKKGNQASDNHSYKFLCRDGGMHPEHSMLLALVHYARSRVFFRTVMNYFKICITYFYSQGPTTAATVQVCAATKPTKRAKVNTAHLLHNAILLCSMQTSDASSSSKTAPIKVSPVSHRKQSHNPSPTTHHPRKPRTYSQHPMSQTALA